MHYTGRRDFSPPVQRASNVGPNNSTRPIISTNMDIQDEQDLVVLILYILYILYIHVNYLLLVNRLYSSTGLPKFMSNPTPILVAFK